MINPLVEDAQIVIAVASPPIPQTNRNLFHRVTSPL
jgi:hypothetical protein